MTRSGRTPRPIEEAREFGRLVELERKARPQESTKALFFRVHRRDSRRWKSERTMYRLWAAFRKDQAEHLHQKGPFAAELLALAQRLPDGGPKTRERKPDTGRQDFEDGG